MPKKRTKSTLPSGGACCGEECCGTDSACCRLPAPGCCQVEAIVSVDGRGQLVLPKEARDRAGFESGRKLALVSWKVGDEVCCLTLQRADQLADAVRRTYGPVISELVRS